MIFMKKIIFVIFTLSLCLLSEENTSDWITVKGEYPLSNITPEEAKTRAVKEAERTAVEKFCCTEVKSYSTVIDYQMKSDFLDAISTGSVIQKELLDCGTDNKGGDLSSTVVWVKIRVKVACSSKNRDPYFKLNAKLNKNTFVHGESSVIQLTPTEDCYITILNITENDSVYQLYPTKSFSQTKLSKNKKWIFPTDIIDNSGESQEPLQFLCPKGKNRTMEYLKIIATKKAHQFVSDDPEFEYEFIEGKRLWSRIETCLYQFQKYFMEIPPSEVTMETLSYEIIR